ncbi:lycopene cyclase domain-containing protein [Carboxylicivirga sp. A043]|uniref:lycopene cyclase domain-containing protein n=1 Tax=Carboxylicivirga litoralis TaxID=2816963 RepID=UPI0021CB060D|nr:lycopene cyclase domain-containing protein [Carboxylicivirga sp. A043]MCU4156465.1 lycopene cyclase domain-containing protein [Carboxylicivirga sp. A043]
MGIEAYTYLFINIACILIPFVASFYPKHAFYKEWRYFLPANFTVALLFLVWDYYFTQMGIWGFNPRYLTKVYLLNLPLEEILFFIAIPYACVFTWFAIKYLVKNNPFKRFHGVITIILAILFLMAGFGFIGKWYTSLTAFLTGLYLLITFYKKRDLSYVYLSYLIVLPFFFISNGILTGSGLEEPIVWYNNAENLGIRIGTIPIEDSVYGFLLVLMNIDLYEWLKKHFA